MLPTPAIGSKPHQPVSFKFPKREYGKKTVVKRSFQPQWFSSWPWLHYDEQRDLVFCYACVKAYREKKLQCIGNLESAYISTGFANWKEARARFSAHESSTCHKDAVLKTVTLPATVRDIGEASSLQHAQDKLERRQCFLKLLSNVRFLAKQGLPLRGDGDELDSNYMQLLKLRGEDDSRVLDWLKRKTDKYTSPEMQNEMISVMAHVVLRQIASSIHSSPFYTIMVDETTDVSNQEQVVLCIRWVSSDFEVHEEFMGLYSVESTRADTLISVIKDVFLRFNFPLSKVRGQCYDGASTMSGYKSGVAAKLLQEEPKALIPTVMGMP